jgi:Family of unknown function (DUF5906)
MSFPVRPSSAKKNLTYGDRSATLADFRAHAPSGMYIYMPCREPWPPRVVDQVIKPQPALDKSGKPKRNNSGGLVTVKASTWLMQNQRVEQLTWAPGEPTLIADRLVVDGGWIQRPEVTCLNMYRPPQIELGDATKVGPWLDHVRFVFPSDADHIIRWLAQRKQQPAIKINHGLVLGSEDFGVGKDMMLAPIRHTVGPWNFREIAPTDLLGTFNPFVKSIILRINEARDLGEINRFAFYDRMKAYTASPPEVLQVNEKHLRQYYAFNCLGAIITTNHKTDGIYLPVDDRRHYIAWSDRSRRDFSDDYWNNLTTWYENGGHGHVAAYLAVLDLSDFDPKAPPTKTSAFWEIVSASQAPEDAELADAIDRLGAKLYPNEIESGTTDEQRRPNVFTLLELIGIQGNAALEDILAPKNRRAVPHRLSRCGYNLYRNTAAKDGLWRINKTRQALYVKASSSVNERKTAVTKYLETSTTITAAKASAR